MKRYSERGIQNEKVKIQKPSYNPFSYKRRETTSLQNIGVSHVPVVVADFGGATSIDAENLKQIGYSYNEATDKWTIGDAAADYIYTGSKIVDFALPGTLQVVCDYDTWLCATDKGKYHPLMDATAYLKGDLTITDALHFVTVDADKEWAGLADKLMQDSHAVLVVSSSSKNAMTSMRSFLDALMGAGVMCPVILKIESADRTVDEQLIHFATDAGGLMLDGFGDGIWLKSDSDKLENSKVSGRTYLEVKSNIQFQNNTAFSILQAARTRISKTEYISCPSCGRTLFDLQETTAKIRAATNHLKGVKIAIMGCIVNGPGEMADADFGYVGSGPGKITLYKGKEVVKRNVPSDIAVDELIGLLKENQAWVEQEVG